MSLTCTRTAGQPVAARLFFVGNGDPSNTRVVQARATNTRAIDRLREDLLNVVAPEGALIPFLGDCPQPGWTEETSVRGLFLRGAGQGEAVANKGGVASVQLTASNLPKHQHGVYPHAGYPTGFPPATPGEQGAMAGDTQTGVHPGSTSEGDFANRAFDIIPPYIAVKYCRHSKSAVN
jgi:hypothetical protein